MKEEKPDELELIAKSGQDAADANWRAIIGAGSTAPAEFIQWHEDYFAASEGIPLCRDWSEGYIRAAWDIYVRLPYNEVQDITSINRCLGPIELAVAAGELVSRSTGEPATILAQDNTITQQNPIQLGAIDPTQCEPDLFEAVVAIKKTIETIPVENYREDLIMKGTREAAVHNWNVIFNDGRIEGPGYIPTAVDFIAFNNNIFGGGLLKDDWLDHYVAGARAIHLRLVGGGGYAPF